MCIRHLWDESFSLHLICYLISAERSSANKNPYRPRTLALDPRRGLGESNSLVVRLLTGIPSHATPLVASARVIAWSVSL